MDILKPCAIALAVSILPHGLCAAPSPHQEEVVMQQWGTIDMKGLEALLNSKVALNLVDARTDKYFDGTLIIGAERLPYDSDPTTIETLLPNKKKLVVVYCGGGECPASKNLAKRLIELGYTNVIDYHGGMEEWESNKKPTQLIKS